MSGMASATPLKDIDEKFLQCAICLGQLNEPTLLPCLHRYCRVCLKKITNLEDKEVRCPTCRQIHNLPGNGADGFKVDFNTRNIIEFIQLQTSIRQDPTRECANCAVRLKMVSYCFRCSDFLCEGCDEHHRVSKIVRDHRDHIVSLGEAAARNLTIDKLSSLKEAPRCREHPEKVSELCCTTCANLPICIACMYGEHQGHGLKEVKTQAKIEREKMKEDLAVLAQREKMILVKQQEVKSAGEKLDQTVREEDGKLQEKLKKAKAKMEVEVSKIDESLGKRMAQWKIELVNKQKRREEIMEKKITRLREEFERVCRDERREAISTAKRFGKERDEEKAMVQSQFSDMNRGIQEEILSIETQRRSNTETIREQSEEFGDILKKFEVIKTTTSSVLSAQNDWTDVQVVPDIRAAIATLIGEEKELPGELDGLTSIAVRKYPAAVDIALTAGAVVTIEGIDSEWFINDIACSNEDCSIVVTGYAPPHRSHLTVFNQKGRRIKQYMYQITDQDHPRRYCAFLPQSSIVTVDQSSNIVVYTSDQHGHRMKANINDIVESLPSQWRVSCMTVDNAKNRIIVGGFDSRIRDHRFILCFDSELEFIYRLKLPKVIQRPRDILALKGGKFVVCDWESMEAYKITRTGSTCKVSSVFSKPQEDCDGWKPNSVCMDKNSFIYILWVLSIPEGRCASFAEGRCAIAQYSHTGSELIATRLLDPGYYVPRFSTLQSEEGEKLSLPTYKTGQLLTYGLSKSSSN